MVLWSVGLRINRPWIQSLAARQLGGASDGSGKDSRSDLQMKFSVCHAITVRLLVYLFLAWSFFRLQVLLNIEPDVQVVPRP